MTALQRWLVQNGAGRPFRAAVSLLLVLVLVAGGAAVASGAGRTDTAPTAVVAEGRQHIGRALVCRAAPVCWQHRRPGAQLARGPARWRDLRHGGLPAPRAPDA